ncbi:LAQU0S12e01750g1_1 [Lachancea quebecensis]|uniref:LAQU0S12e01750g1_1 n=1 Tax=Lachancea quebecensis TaxID=1654605 RepID=A0A0P1KUG3_9SACH|nr:LAQU0S12e01750g1_1 [Lachancea quebecensis]
MGQRKAPKSEAKSGNGSTETQGMDPLFGQSRAFALEGAMVNPEVRNYLKNVRTQALSTLGADPGTSSRKEPRRVSNNDMYDEGPVVHQDLLRFDKQKSQWLAWFEDLKTSVQSFDPQTESYEPETLDLLLFFFKQYLQKLKDATSGQDESLNKILDVLEEHKAPTEDTSLDIDEEWANNLLAQLKTNKQRKVETVSDLKRFITEPAALPKNFNAWHYFVTKTDPSCTLLRNMPPEEVFRIASYFVQWLADIPKGKNATRLSSWAVYVLVFLQDQLPAQEVSVLRDLGKKARHLKLRSLSSGNALPKIQAPYDITGAKDCPSALSALDLTLVVVACKYGQLDLIDWTESR